MDSGLTGNKGALTPRPAGGPGSWWMGRHERKLAEIKEKGGALVYDGKHDIPVGKGYAVALEKARKAGLMTSRHWVEHLPNCYLAICCEFGYSLCGGVFSQDGGRELGRSLLKAVSRTCSQAESVECGADRAAFEGVSRSICLGNVGDDVEMRR